MALETEENIIQSKKVSAGGDQRVIKAGNSLKYVRAKMNSLPPKATYQPGFCLRFGFMTRSEAGIG